MKGVIVEIRGDMAAILSDDGYIVKVKNKNYEIGQEVEINMKSNFKLKFVAIAAACFMLLFGGSALAYYTPTKYVSLDVNPSIEYKLNMFNIVLSVKGVNDDGSEIVGEIDPGNLINKKVDEAIALTVEKIAEKGYLDIKDGEGGIEIAISSKNMEKAKELAQTLENVVNKVCKENNREATVNAEAVGAERVAKARELGVTPGKLNLVEKLIESSKDPGSVHLNEWLNKPVKEIMAQIKQNKQQNKDQNKEQEQNSDEDIKNQEQNQNKENNDKSGVISDDGTVNLGKDNGKSYKDDAVSLGNDKDKDEDKDKDKSDKHGTVSLDKGKNKSDKDDGTVNWDKGNDKSDESSNNGAENRQKGD